ncbi:MAG: hypothetical protein MKZ94_08670 [Pirellulales bacterium]|nr:hypothetical protein [Pirellulales bacterium]
MSTAPSIQCPHCNQQMQYVAELAGQDAVCPTCNQIFNVPAIELTTQAVQSGTPATPFGGGSPGLKPLPAQYAHLRKDATGVHNKKIFWLCVLGIAPIFIWVTIIIIGEILRTP